MLLQKFWPKWYQEFQKHRVLHGHWVHQEVCAWRGCSSRQAPCSNRQRLELEWQTHCFKRVKSSQHGTKNIFKVELICWVITYRWHNRKTRWTISCSGAQLSTSSAVNCKHFFTNGATLNKHCITAFCNHNKHTTRAKRTDIRVQADDDVAVIPPYQKASVSQVG